ncbi:MAG TPA: PRC-barrel domain-containing protein [Ktedonobacteraceae bacterium]|jgi:uncharacterized protein YrrD|nr:PRC-barrel domain-containing protein [Ktedonobacteraceae bacterium]
MSNNEIVRKWSEIRGRTVMLPSEGRAVGTVVDFYFKPETNYVDAFCVRTRLHGDLALPATGISSISKDAITIPNAQVLLKALPPFPKGENLLSHKVTGERGADLGTVGDVLIGFRPPVLWIAGFEVTKGRHSNKVLDADDVMEYREDGLVIQEQAARSLR